MKLVLPRSFAEYLEGETEVVLDVKDLDELKIQLKEINPKLYRRIYDDEGNQRVFVKFFLGKQMLDENNNNKIIEEEDTLTIISAVAGG